MSYLFVVVILLVSCVTLFFYRCLVSVDVQVPIKPIKICVFSMVKNERDIMESFVYHYGTTFGYENVHIIDNFSDDGTYEILQALQTKHDFTLVQKHSYKQKHVYMLNMMKEYVDTCDYALPTDVDEFVVLCNEVNHTMQAGAPLLEHFNMLPTNYDALYLNTVILPVHDTKFTQIELEATYGVGHNEDETIPNYAKVIINLMKSAELPILQHGNHVHDLRFADGRSPHVTKADSLCTVHFHFRNEAQLRKKVLANWGGLGHNTTDINEVRNITEGIGFHYKNEMIKLLSNETLMPSAQIVVKESNRWYLAGLSSYLLNARGAL